MHCSGQETVTYALGGGELAPKKLVVLVGGDKRLDDLLSEEPSAKYKHISGPQTLLAQLPLL